MASLHVATLASMFCTEQPTRCADEVRIVALHRPGSDAIIAKRWTGNVIHLDVADLKRFAGGTLIVNSGSLGENLHDLHPGNWMAGAAARLADRVAALRGEMERLDLRLLIEPHSRHILNDAPTAAAFLREFGDDRIGLAFNPCALFEPSMLDFAEDHLLRMAEALSPLASVVILADAAPDASGESLLPTDLGRGEFDPRPILRAVLDARNQAAKGERGAAGPPTPTQQSGFGRDGAVILRRLPAGAAGESLIGDLHRLLAQGAVD